MALEMALRRMNVTSATVHGFRSSFRDWVAAETSTDYEVAENALAHTVGNAIGQSYLRGDLLEKRRDLMRKWDQYCYPQPSSNVVKLKQSIA